MDALGASLFCIAFIISGGGKMRKTVLFYIVLVLMGLALVGAGDLFAGDSLGLGSSDDVETAKPKEEPEEEKKEELKRDTVHTLDAGLLYVAKDYKSGDAVIVICEMDNRGSVLLAWITKTISQKATAVIMPKGTATEKGWENTEALLERLPFDAKENEDEGEEKIEVKRNLYCLGFSMAGQQAYQFAFSNVKKFSGLIIVSAKINNFKNDGLDDAGDFPVLLTHGTNEPQKVAGWIADIKKKLDAKKIKNEVKIMQGATHMQMMQKHFGDYADWVAEKEKALAEKEDGSKKIKQIQKITPPAEE